ncbi:MAG: outer membrane protein transport protein [Desulfobulbus sp.]|nr:outer membrane protein transport protein [Desulfobulbus sp.]
MTSRQRPQVWGNPYACGLFLAWGLLNLTALPHSAQASGFRITNQSLGAVGIAGAHIAYTPGPDASYYNPANMVFQPNQWRVETSLTTLSLPSITYTANQSSFLNGESASELFFMPLIHAVSPQYGRLRFGFSLTYPYGLAKQWPQAYPRAFAQKFSLITVEANPSVAYQVNDWLSLGGGVSFIYGKGEVDNDFTNPPFSDLAPLTSLSRSTNASDTSFGYNLALSLRPTDRWNIAATYRSEVELDLSGSGTLEAMIGSSQAFYFPVSTSIGLTLPAVFSLATSYSLDRLTVELGWDRTYWSSFKQLDFEYDQNYTATPFAVFDTAISKNWKDTNAYRIGLTYDWNERWTTTLGFAYDETPVPSQTLGFELPDTDATVYCAGVRYRYSPNIEIGLSYMYHRTKTRSVSNSQGVDGTFTDGGAHAVTIGLITAF